MKTSERVALTALALSVVFVVAAYSADKQWCYSTTFNKMPCTVNDKNVTWLEMQDNPDRYFVSDRHMFADEEYILILSKDR